MKIRNGFVSNSSSCSFVIALAKVKNMDIARKFLKPIMAKASNCGIVSFTDIKNNFNEDQTIFYSWENMGITSDESSVTLESFDYTTVHLEDLSDKDSVFYLYYVNGCDDDFWNKETGEYDYDRVYTSDFPLFSTLFEDGGNVRKSGLSHFSYAIGAGRAG